MILPPLDPGRARDLAGRLRGKRVLVVGDLMLDRFIVGQVTRISPEAPVPVVRYQSEYSRLGGAANVAHNMAALGAEVSIVGIVGRDASAATLREQLTAAQIAFTGLVEDPSRPTVQKVRVVTGRNQQVARIDYEEDVDASHEIEGRLIHAATSAGRHADVLVVSDYLKGTITKGLVEALVKLTAGGTSLVIDPKIPHLDCYAGATLVTPNQQETETATHRRIRTDDDAREAAVEFRVRAGCEAVLVTRGEHGMWLSAPTVEGAVPSVAREVSDVTGAGDTVIATLALALAAGASLPEAAVLANHAAGLVVAKFGPATVTPEELIAAISV